VANFRAITAVSQAMLYLLESQYRADDFDGNPLQFEIYLARDFSRPVSAGVSLFLYRVLPNGAHRQPQGRVAPNGQRYRSQLPLDLHFLLTAWAEDPSLQHTLIGWMMRVLDDTPILPVGILDAVAPGVFRPDETVEISLAEIATEDLLRLWETLTENRYYLSVPYVARNIWLESEQLLPGQGMVQERDFGFREQNRND
jgi:hypothetical protein